MEQQAIWKIENFSILTHRGDDGIDSSPIRIFLFEPPFSKYVDMTLTLLPRADYNDNICCKVEFNSTSMQYIKNIKVSVIDAYGSVYFTKNISKKVKTLLCQRSKLMKKQYRLLPNDVLMLKICLTVEVSSQELYTNAEQLRKDLKKLYKSKEFSDIILTANGIDFPVHKFILQSRASEFWECFNLEQTKLKRDISNVNSSALENYLKIVYTSCLEKKSSEKCSQLDNLLERLDLQQTKKELLQSSCCTSITTTVLCQQKEMSFLANIDAMEIGKECFISNCVVNMEFLSFLPVIVRTERGNMQHFKIKLKHIQFITSSILLIVDLLVSDNIPKVIFRKYFEKILFQGIKQTEIDFFMKKDKLLKSNSPSNSCHIQLHLSSGNGISSCRAYSDNFELTPNSLNSNKIFFHLKSLFFNHSNFFTDVKIQMRDGEIYAHRALLSCRSPVFSSIFCSDDNKCKTEVVIKVRDFNYSTMYDLMNYIYTGSVSLQLILEQIISLYEVSNKYEVLSLVRACADKLVSCLTIKSSCTILLLANTHNDAYLMEESKNFICKNWNAVKHIKDWGLLEKSNISLAYSVTQAILDKHYTAV